MASLIVHKEAKNAGKIPNFLLTDTENDAFCKEPCVLPLFWSLRNAVGKPQEKDENRQEFRRYFETSRLIPGLVPERSVITGL